MSRILSVLAWMVPTLVWAQGFPPPQAVERMKVPSGFRVTCVAHEPMVRQPLSLSFDERGRLWVLQYLQYPNPAGLKPIKQDQYLRTVWDRVPEAPPKGPKGLDKITILFDPDEQGKYQQAKDFITGLNLATGFCIGNDGVYVVQPPYLLFYPDTNHDDVPDGDPEVLLTGFGMEDTHSYANSLQWGPDGWLYGAHGSTVTAKIRGLEFQQGIWRYHPKTKQFELFAEGGGNTYGLDFDKYGRAIAGTNWGGFAMLHQVQGGYYVKGFAKHGPLHNPHSYGYFDHVPYKNFKGGHVTCGGILYQADTFPKEYHDQYIAGNLLSNDVYWHKMTELGSSFTAQHGGDLLISNDTWCRPVDCLLGPDGSVYMADWYDKRAAHLDPIDNWDKTNGRIYKISYQTSRKTEPFNLRNQNTAQLISLLQHPNKWWRNEARRLLLDRAIDASTRSKLEQLLEDKTEVTALEAFWTLHGLDLLKDNLYERALASKHPHLQTWAVRLLGDSGSIPKPLQDKLIALAANKDTTPGLRSQLACTAKRLTGELALAILNGLLTQDGDGQDPHIPMLIWWAIEDKALAYKQNLLGWFTNQSDLWNQPIVQQFLLERLARRWISESRPELVQTSMALLQAAPDEASALRIVQGMAKALEGKAMAASTDLSAVTSRWHKQIDQPDYLRLLIRCQNSSAYQHVLKQVQNPSGNDSTRLLWIDLLAEAKQPDAIPVLLRLLKESKSEALQLGILSALQRFNDATVMTEVLARFPNWKGKLRQQAQAMLVARPASATSFLQLVDAGMVSTKEVSLDQVRLMQEFKEEAIDQLIRKHWGQVGQDTPGEKKARIAWLNMALNREKGDPQFGKLLYQEHCSVCHQLHGQGNRIGPDLTSADRKNRSFLLTHIIDPSISIRQEYLTHNVQLADGRRLSGVMEPANGDTLTLVNVISNQPQRITIQRKEIEEINPSAVSIMPEKLLDTMTDTQVAHLFAYLASDPPKQESKKWKVLLISGSLEYKSDESLAEWQTYLEKNFPVECVRAFRKTDEDLPGLEHLESCDVAVFYTRRLKIKGEQLERVKKYVTSGKPIIGLRTASHGFQNWLEMDKEIFGGDYKNHYKEGPKCEVKIEEKQKEHPILKGVKPFGSVGSLYKNPNISKDVNLLLRGSIPDYTEPIAWTRELKGTRIFYTSLGHPQDFKDENFIRLLTNALFWVMKQEAPK